MASRRRPHQAAHDGQDVRPGGPELLAWRPELRERLITRLDLLQYRDWRAEKTSPWSANRSLRALKACLRWAQLAELDHPLIQLGRLLLPVPDRDDLGATAEETRRVLEAAALDLPCLAILRIAAATGLRLGEILHLWWRDIDPEAGTLRVTTKPGWVPKSRAALREVRAAECVQWLLDYKRTLRHRAPDDFVCQMHPESGEGWRYPTSTAVHQRLRHVYERAGVTGVGGGQKARKSGDGVTRPPSGLVTA